MIYIYAYAYIRISVNRRHDMFIRQLHSLFDVAYMHLRKKKNACSKFVSSILPLIIKKEF